jgi:hypothetical protein
VLTADRASLSESATPHAARLERATDQYQPRRGPRHRSLTRMRRMRTIVTVSADYCKLPRAKYIANRNSPSSTATY